MSGGLIDKVFIGLDNAPAAFDIKGRILGPNGTNLEYIRSETGVVAVLKNDKFEPLHLALHHTRSEALVAARSLAQNLIETIRAELAQWSAAQAGGPPPALNVPPPTLATTTAPPPVPPPVATVALSTPSSLTSTAHPTVMPPVVSVAPAAAPLMTVRQPTVLQLLPQQQYVLNQENGQLIPIVQPGVQVSNTNFTSLPIAQSLGTLQQPNFGTQIVDISSMQPVNVTQLRLSGVPSSMSMILPNGLTFPQASLTNADTTTVSSATSTPVVCAAQSTNASQKILYSTDKGDKDVKYHIQGADTVQWTVPGSQTMLIPYQQLQELTSNQTGLTNLQPQQFVSIAPAGGLPQTSLPLTAAQLQQLQATGTIMQLNQKPIASSASLINIISTGQASSPQIISSSATPTKNVGSQESRGQKRLSDGTPSQLQLRPIAPAGSHVSQDKSSSREARSWTAGRDNTVVSMGMKINPAHGTIIHVSSGQQTNVSASGITQDGTGMYIRQVDRNSIQIQSSKDGQKQDITANKIQSTAQNVQMITVPPGMTVLQNPLNISQMPTMIGQPNSQVYMIPANPQSIVQGTLPPGLIGQQVLQPGQNVTVMQPNQLGVPGGVQYNVPLMPMNMPASSQYMSGINLNTQLSAQQLNAALAGQQLANQNLAVSGTIPIVQAPPPASPMTNPGQTIPVSQPPPIHQIIPQNTFITPTSQYAGMPPQYMMQGNSGTITVPTNTPNVQYSLPTNQAATPAPNNGNGTITTTTENDTTNGVANQGNYITSSPQENGFSTSVQTQGQQNFSTDGTSAPTTGFTSTNQTVTQTGYGNNGGANTQNTAYNVNQTTTTQPPTASYPTNGSSPQTANQSYGASSTPTSQNTSQTNFSPSTTPAPNQTYPAANLPNMPNVSFPPNQNPQNPYPNATGQNLAAYASNQYQYTSRPWFRPRYGSPQGSPYSSGAGPPPNGPPMPVPPPSGNYNYWQDS